MYKQVTSILNRLKIVLLLGFIPLFAGCSDSSSYNVSDNPDIGRSVINELHGYLEPFILALGAAGVACNAVLIIFEPFSTSNPDEALAMAKKRIGIIICAVLAFEIIKIVFSTDFVTFLG